MTSNQPYRIPGGKVALGVVLAIVIGALTPVLTVLEMSVLMPVVLLSGVFMAFLYFYAGPVPAWLFTGVQLASTAFALDTTFMWMLLVGGTLPAAVVIRGIARKQPFFEQLRRGIAAYAAGVIGAILIAYMRYGGNMIGKLVDALQGQFDLMPDEMFAPFVDALNAALTASGLPGMRQVTVSDYRAQLTGILSLLGDTYGQTLPGTLLSGAALSGVLSVLWGNWIQARRGLATNDSYVGLNAWFLPRQVTFGLALIWVVSYILSETGYAGGSAAYTTVYQLVSMAFYVQALAAIDRFFYRRGASSRRRTRLVVLAMVFGLLFRLFGAMMFILGAASALFGSHGAIRRASDRSNDNPSDRGDPEQ